MLPVAGLYESKTINVHQVLAIICKNISRIFEAEILKIFKNIQPQPKY